jgi:hypothetical protein
MPPGRTIRSDLAADARVGDFLVQLADEPVQIGGVPPGRRGVVAELPSLGTLLDPPSLVLGGRVGFDLGFVLEVPALPALGRPQALGPLRAGRADAGEGVPAGDEYRVGFAGVEVGAAELDGADAGTVLDGRSRTTWRASGIAIRCARVVLAVLALSVTGHPRTRMIGIASIWVGAVPGARPAAQAALIPRCRAAAFEQDQPGGADRARLISPPGGDGGHAASSQFGQALVRHRPDIRVGHPPGPDPHRIRVRFQPDVGDPGAGGRVGGDQLAGGAAVPGAIAEHHVGLLGLVEPHPRRPSAMAGLTYTLIRQRRYGLWSPYPCSDCLISWRLLRQCPMAPSRRRAWNVLVAKVRQDHDDRQYPGTGASWAGSRSACRASTPISAGLGNQRRAARVNAALTAERMTGMAVSWLMGCDGSSASTVTT